MKVALTISDIDGVSLPALIAALGLAGMPITINQPGAAGDDEDNAPANTAAPALDSTGLPHDERIHSKAKTVTDAGAWRKRKGVADSLVIAVEAELRARNPGAPITPASTAPAFAPQVTQPAAMPMPPMQPQMPPQQPGAYPTGPGYPQQPGNVQPGPLAAALPYQPQPAAIPMPPQQPAPQPAPQPGAVDFNGFMQHLTGKMAQPSPDGNGMMIDAAYLQRIVAEISAAFQTQLTVITDISANPQMIGYAIQLMQRDQKW